MEYEDFLESKRVAFDGVGFELAADNPDLFPFQRDFVRLGDGGLSDA